MSHRCDNIGGACKSKVYSFDEQVIVGERPYTHIIISIDPTLPAERLASLTLFLSQLVEAANKENRRLLLTLQFSSTKSEIPIEMRPLDENTTAQIISELVEAALRAKITPDKWRNDARPFSWQTLGTVFEKEARDYSVEHRIVFYFQPGKEPLPAASVEADLAVAQLDGREGYPLHLMSIGTPQDKTTNLTRHFSTLSPCEMHRRFVEMFGYYEEAWGKLPVSRLFSSGVTDDSFLLTNALRARLETGEKLQNPSICDARFAFNTAETGYFKWVDGVYLSSRFGIDETDTFKQSLYLFTMKQNAPPAAGDIAGLPSGYYELLKEAANQNRRAPAYFIHHMLELAFLVPLMRMKFNKDEGSEGSYSIREDYDGPLLEKTVPQYLEGMQATPLNMFEALLDIEGFSQLAMSSYDSFITEKLTGFPYDSEAYDSFIKAIFTPLADNFKKLPPHKQMAEIEKIIAYANSNIGSLIGRDENRRSYIYPFLLALDIAFSAVEDKKELKEKLAHGIVDALVSIPSDKIISNGVPDALTTYLTGRHLMDSSDSEKIMEWTFDLEKLEETDHRELLESIVQLWKDVWPLVYSENRDELQMALAKKVASIFSDRVKFEGHEKTYNEYSRYYSGYLFGAQEPGDTRTPFVEDMTSILGPRHMGMAVAYFINEGGEQALDNIWSMLRRIHDKLTFDEWKIFVGQVMANTEDAWQFAPFAMDASREDARRPEIMDIVYNGLKKFDNWKKVFNDDRYYIIGTIKAIHDGDVEKITGLFRSYYAEKRTRSMGRNSMYDVLFGYYLPDDSKRAMLSYILENTTSPAEEQPEDFEALISMIDPSIFASYDEATHGELLIALLSRYEKGADSSETNYYLDNLIIELFPYLPIPQKKLVLTRMLLMLERLEDKDRLYKHLGHLDGLIESIDEVGLLQATSVVFPFLTDALSTGKIATDSDFVETFFKKWGELFPKLDFNEQCKAFIYFAGPLAPISMRFNDFLPKMTKNMLEHTQEKDRAYILGGHIARSPYAAMMASTLFGDKSKIGATGREGILDGFVDEIYAGGVPKSRFDAEIFIEYAIMSYWKLESGIHYYRHVPEFLGRKIQGQDMPIDLARMILMPERNRYYMETEEGRIVWLEKNEIEMFDNIISSDRIPSATKSYAMESIRQIIEDLSKLKTGKVYGLEGLKAVYDKGKKPQL